MLRRVIFSITLVYVFQRIPSGVGAFSADGLIAYAVVSYFISSLVHTYGMGGMGNEIESGDLANYLVKPLKFLPYWAARMVATRLLLVVAGVIGIAVIGLTTGASISVFFSAAQPLETALLLTGALVIVQLVDFLAGMLAFWTDDNHGMQWLIMTSILFLSGALIPLNVLPEFLQRVLALTPFPSMVYAPTQMWLGNYSAAQFVQAFFVQIAWIGGLLIATYAMWRRGVKMYGAYGR